MDTERLNSCSVCMDEFMGDIRPRCLPCGHSFCRSCLENSVKDKTMTCPQCKRSYIANSIDEFPINYGMEALISKLINLQSNAIPEHMKNYSQEKLSRNKWQEFFNDQKESLRNLIKITDEMQCDVLRKHHNINHRIRKHETLISKFSELIIRSKDIIREFKSEANRLAVTLKERDELQKRANATISKYEVVTSTKDIVTGSDEVADCQESLDEWRTKTMLQLTRTTNIEASKMLLGERIDSLLYEISEDKDETLEGTLGLSASSSLSVRNEIQSIRGKQIITVQELKSKSAEVMNLVMKGQLYATQNVRGQIRSAKITLHNNRLYIHSLRDEEPPLQARIIRHGDVMSSVDPSMRTAFLDLGTNESTLGRLLIRMSPDTKSSNNFFLLATAESGPSYLNTKLLEVHNKGKPGVFVEGGDYEYNTGEGGKGVVEGVGEENGGVLVREFLAGSVCGSSYNGDEWAAQFCIATTDKPGASYDRVFGQVESGLDVLREAIINYPNIEDVSIIDCGIFIDL